MAKNIYASYALLGIVLAASACSHEDGVRGGNGKSEGRIEFNASLPEVSSRATELKAASLNEIEVSAFTPGESGETTYFANKIFGRNNNTNTCVCSVPAC
ncbi:MAG: fimbrillin family protein, partial [Muribaculaceae bacterium]|nr:fimbrillin family protein [Muribaculaceae bacterium]